MRSNVLGIPIKLYCTSRPKSTHHTLSTHCVRPYPMDGDGERERESLVNVCKFAHICTFQSAITIAHNHSFGMMLTLGHHENVRSNST